MNRISVTSALAAILTFGASHLPGWSPSEGAAESYPKFEVDPAWPKKLPNGFLLGDVGGLAVDSHDHIWVVTRPRSLKDSHMTGLADNPPTAECCRPAPAVVEFDADGRYIQGWGGPNLQTEADRAAYQWPENEHGITVDHKDNVWVCGNGQNDNQCLKFSREGKFLLQIGHSGQSKGSLDTENLNRASQVAVWPKTNEVFIADGYVNRRVIVFDADTGKFKRMWGAYGNKPDDTYPRTNEALRSTSPPAPPQYDLVHGIRISKDGLVYVSDRRNNRIQVFTVEGQFIREGFVARTTTDSFGTSFGLAFSPDSEQKLLYAVDAPNFKVRILDRQTIEEIPGSAFGHGGPYPGQWHWLHNVGVDSQGNIYTAESRGARVQKFIYKGMSQ